MQTKLPTKDRIYSIYKIFNIVSLVILLLHSINFIVGFVLRKSMLARQFAESNNYIMNYKIEHGLFLLVVGIIWLFLYLNIRKNKHWALQGYIVLSLSIWMKFFHQAFFTSGFEIGYLLGDQIVELSIATICLLLSVLLYNHTIFDKRKFGLGKLLILYFLIIVFLFVGKSMISGPKISVEGEYYKDNYSYYVKDVLTGNFVKIDGTGLELTDND